MSAEKINICRSRHEERRQDNVIEWSSEEQESEREESDSEWDKRGRKKRRGKYLKERNAK